MTWQCSNCARNNALSDPQCKSCPQARPAAFTVLSYAAAGASPYLILVLLFVGGYARVQFIGRAKAQREVDAGVERERALKTDLTESRAEGVKLSSELSSAKAKLQEANTELGRVKGEAEELRGLVAVQSERLAQRPPAALKSVNLYNRCATPVRFAIRFREPDGNWRNAVYPSLVPGQHRLQIYEGTAIKELKVTWNMTYIYAEAFDRSWFYRGVDGEVETAIVDGRSVTMKRWDLPADADDNYSVALCR